MIQFGVGANCMENHEFTIIFLASQPLCFNLFGELTKDLKLASDVLGDMSNGRVAHVTEVEFEWSPGRGEKRYTGDHSAFDIYVRFKNSKNERGFLGIEVKYHENLEESTQRTQKYFEVHGSRYKEIAAEMGCFRKNALDRLGQDTRLQQIWRDHLLAGSHLLRTEDGFEDGFFVLL